MGTRRFLGRPLGKYVSKCPEEPALRREGRNLVSFLSYVWSCLTWEFVEPDRQIVLKGS